MELKINPERWNSPESVGDSVFDGVTGIYVRALTPDGKWDNADLCQLDKESVKQFLESKQNGALNIVMILLGYNPYTE